MTETASNVARVWPRLGLGVMSWDGIGNIRGGKNEENEIYQLVNNPR